MAHTNSAETTKSRIRDYLTRSHGASVTQLSQSLGLTRSNIHYHLDQLILSGEVEVIPDPTPQGRGRPQYSYRLAALHAENNFLHFLKALIETVFPRDTGDPTIVTDLAARLFPPVEETRNLTQKLNAILSRMNRHGYHARWEARKEGPCVFFQNCPYRAIVKDHPILCQIDAAILGLNLKKRVRQQAWVDPDRPGSACVFQVSDTGSEPGL